MDIEKLWEMLFGFEPDSDDIRRMVPDLFPIPEARKKICRWILDTDPDDEELLLLVMQHERELAEEAWVAYTQHGFDLDEIMRKVPYFRVRAWDMAVKEGLSRDTIDYIILHVRSLRAEAWAALQTHESAESYIGKINMDEYLQILEDKNDQDDIELEGVVGLIRDVLTNPV